MTQVGQGALDLVVSPGHILPRKANNKIDDLLPYTWASRRFATLTVVPLLGNEGSVPPQDRIGHDNCGQLHQGFST